MSDEYTSNRKDEEKDKYATKNSHSDSNGKAEKKMKRESVTYTIFKMGIISALLFIFINIFYIKAKNSYYKFKYLPNEILDNYIENPTNDIEIKIPIYIEANDFQFKDLGEAVRIQLENRIRKSSILVQWRPIIRIIDDIENIEGNDCPIEESAGFNGSVFSMRLLLSDEVAIYIDPTRHYGELYYTRETVTSNDLPYFIAQMVYDHVFINELDNLGLDNFFEVHESLSNSKSSKSLNRQEKQEPSVSTTVPKRGGQSGEQEQQEQNEIYSHYYVPSQYFNTSSNSVKKDVINKIDERNSITVKFIKLSEDNIKWEINDAIELFFKKFKKDLEWFTEIKIEIIERSNNNNTRNSLTAEENLKLENEIEQADNYPSEFFQLDDLTLYYKETFKNNSNNIYFLIYPFSNNVDILKGLNVDGTDIYSQSENTFISVPFWGGIYFSHLRYSQDKIFTVNDLKDAIDSCKESVLNYFKFPGVNLIPKQRILMELRSKTIDNLVLLSYELFKIRKHVFNNYDDIYSDKELKIIPNQLINTVNSCLSIRKESIDSLKEMNWFHAYKKSVESLASLRDYKEI
ncbi:hypothetical protein B5S33_g2714 [[Candida] boidinii]|nr:hypothetical protein B5S30_g5587 [[Candida] boidinii]OWB84077.1 hypothetical protein B5S33_g2714 [[Candida] boidinii]